MWSTSSTPRDLYAVAGYQECDLTVRAFESSEAAQAICKTLPAAPGPPDL
jgi:hypothetical protein